MKRLFEILLWTVIFVLFSWSTVSATEIFNRYNYASPTRHPTKTYEEDRIITGHQGVATTLAFRLSLYGSAAEKMPLLVQVHEWGGDFDRMEELAGYIPNEYEFVMLYFQFKPSSGNESNWWFGTRWDDVCQMWAHQAIMAIVKEVVANALSNKQLGATIDPNRVYLFGHSIGGTGVWQLGMRNPDVFAAIHAHSGFARFTPPVGPFEDQFITDIVGSNNESVTLFDTFGTAYPARDYSNLAWWLTNYQNPNFETPFVSITAGTDDDIVPIASGGDLMCPVLESQKRGFFYHRHSGGHSAITFVQMNWMWNFKRNESFLAFTNRNGYGIEPNQTVNPWISDGYASGGVNNLYEFGWDPDTIVDREDRYEVQLTGSGTADITLRRLQAFKVTAGENYSYWLDTKSGLGTTVNADINDLLTIPSVTGPHLLIIEPSFTIRYVEKNGSCAGNIPCHEIIQAAFTAANNGDQIRIASGSYDETLLLNADKALTLQGGWDSSFQNQTGNTVLRQAPRVVRGSITLQMLTINSD